MTNKFITYTIINKIDPDFIFEIEAENEYQVKFYWLINLGFNLEKRSDNKFVLKSPNGKYPILYSKFKNTEEAIDSFFATLGYELIIVEDEKIDDSDTIYVVVDSGTVTNIFTKLELPENTKFEIIDLDLDITKEHFVDEAPRNKEYKFYYA